MGRLAERGAAGGSIAGACFSKLHLVITPARSAAGAPRRSAPGMPSSRGHLELEVVVRSCPHS
jgi:hypothetical protein